MIYYFVTVLSTFIISLIIILITEPWATVNLKAWNFGIVVMFSFIPPIMWYQWAMSIRHYVKHRAAVEELKHKVRRNWKPGLR
jgi:hypothetical protein